jgi:uncharacterized protein YndB with AHSA1/START domain
MAIFTRTQTINKPVEDVFSTVIDVASFPTWNPTVRSARKLSEGPIGEGTRFEMTIKGYGSTCQVLREFQENRQVRLVPEIKSLAGGHRFIFTAQGDRTRVDHELEVVPKGIFKALTPLMGMLSRKNLRDTATALQAYLESR